jgi:hypothetical protein
MVQDKIYYKQLGIIKPIEIKRKFLNFTIKNLNIIKKLDVIDTYLKLNELINNHQKDISYSLNNKFNRWFIIQLNEELKILEILKKKMV